MTNEELMQTALNGRLWLAAGAIVAGLITLAVRSILIFCKKAEGHSNSTFRAGTLEFSSNTIGGLLILVSLAWGIVGIAIAPKLKLNGNEVVLNLFEHPLDTSVAVLTSAKTRWAADVGMSDLYSEFTDLAGQKLVARGISGSDAKIQTQMEILDSHPVFKVETLSNGQTVAMTYVPVREGKILKFVPVEMAAKSASTQGPILRFDCNSSIQAFLRKASQAGENHELQTHRRALIERCDKEIQELQAADKAKLIN